MEGPNVEEHQSLDENHGIEVNQSIEKMSGFKSPRRKKMLFIILGVVLVGVVAGVWIFIKYGIPRMSEMNWVSNQMIAVYIAVGFVAASIVAWLILRRTLRTRLRMHKAMRDDPDVNDWLIIFNWTAKVLYVPTIVASLLASVLMYLREAELSFFGSIPAVVIGGGWLAVFFLNFLVEEYSISIKILLITFVSLGCFFLWLHLLGWVVGFLRLFRHLALSINATGFLLIGIIGVLTVFVSWFKGLFYYMTITPNYMNLQEGPTESGEQIGREDYNSRIDTSDFLERLMGFGRIVITFKDRKREPITVLVWRIQKKAQMLEKVRAKFAIDHIQQKPPLIS